MFKELTIDNYLAVVYYTNLNDLCGDMGEIFDFSSMLYKTAFQVSSRYELNDICNKMLQENKFVCAVDLHFNDCTLDARFRVEKHKNANKYHLVIW